MADDYIEPPADEAAAFVPPPSLEHHEDLTTARLAGYSWPEINGDLQQRTTAAYQAGYTQPEIDQHLGYIEPQGLQNDLDRHWQMATAADPKLVTGLEGVPRAALTPLDGLSASRVADYAGVPPPTATDAERDDTPSPLDLNTYDMRGSYVDALLSGGTRSPLDFAERAAGAFLGVGVDLSDSTADQASTVAQAARELAANLPSNEDLTDVAIGLAQVGGGVPLTPGMIAVIKDNLADLWAKTGQPLMDIYRSASQDPDLLNALQMPRPAPSVQVPAPDIAKAFAYGMGFGLGAVPETIKVKGEQDAGLSLAEALGIAVGRVPRGIVDSVIETAKRAGEALMGGDPLTPKEAIDAAAIGLRLEPMTRVSGGLRTQAKVVDPLAPVGEATKLVPGPEAFSTAASPLDKVAEAVAKEMTPGENLAAKLQQLEKIELENRTPNQLETGSFFQRKLAEMGEEAPRGPEPTVQEVADLAEGHYTAAELANTFDDLLKDTSGAGLNPFATAARDADRTAWLSPTFRADFDAARAQIREGRGGAGRVAAQAFQSLEKYRREINQHLPEFEKEVKLGPAGNPDNTVIGNLYNYMEGRSTGATLKDSNFKPVADVIRVINEDMAARINNSGQGQAFIDDYFVHMWKDPRSAREVYGVGRQGSGASLNTREIPTISDGLARGLEPRILDPIEAQLHYTAAMSRHLGWQDILHAGEQAGYVDFHPIGAAPEGRVKLNGAGALLKRGLVDYYAYAPPGYASAYNRSIDTGWYNSPIGGAIYDKLRFVANGMTAAKLAFSGYHAFNIVKESIAADLTSTIGRLARGQLADGLKSMALTPSAPVRQAYRGGQMTKQYLGVKDYGPEMAEIVDALTGANMRMTGRQAIYRVGDTPTIFQSLQRGTLGRELKQDVTNIFGSADQAPAARIALAAPRMAEFAFKEIGRVLDTAMASLFDKYIPAVKNAAAFDEMQSWMKANKNASHEDLLRMARMISDSMDDRFGEMNQDNLFWNQHVKQSINMAVVSTGWEWGSMRAFIGAGKDALKRDFNSTRVRWAVSYPIIVGLMASAYMALKTGAAPQEPLDLAFGKTGGTLQSGLPARVIQPGYEKDVGQWYKALRLAPDFIGSLQSFGEIAMHKGNPMIQAMRATMTGEDAIGHHIRNLPNAPFIGVPGTDWALPPGMANYVKFWAEQFVPIPLQAPRVAGSNISDIENFLGFRLAPKYLVDPEGYAAGMERLEKRRDKEELGRARRENSQLEEPTTHFEPAGPLPQRSRGGGGGRTPSTPQRSPDPSLYPPGRH